MWKQKGGSYPIEAGGIKDEFPIAEAAAIMLGCQKGHGIHVLQELKIIP